MARVLKLGRHVGVGACDDIVRRRASEIPLAHLAKTLRQYAT